MFCKYTGALYQSLSTESLHWLPLVISRFPSITIVYFTFSISMFLCKDNAGTILKPLLISNDKSAPMAIDHSKTQSLYYSQLKLLVPLFLDKHHIIKFLRYRPLLIKLFLFFACISFSFNMNNSLFKDHP